MNKNEVTKPAMTLKSGDQTFQIWMLNPGQYCKCTPAPCHEFQARKTASLVYESFGVGMHSCVEYDINHPKIWSWISEHMQNQLNTLNLPVA